MNDEIQALSKLTSRREVVASVPVLTFFEA
jgi:hypothetical protein